MIVEATNYFAREGQADEVLKQRRKATEIRRQLGLEPGRILVRMEGSGPDVSWECDFVSREAYDSDRAARASSPDFEAARKVLHRAGVRWVLFAATRQLRNAFDRLRLATVVLADARSDRLQGDASQWGSYYDAQPQVLFGDIASGHAFLHRAPAAPAPVALPRNACLAVAR